MDVSVLCGKGYMRDIYLGWQLYGVRTSLGGMVGLARLVAIIILI